MVNWIRYRKDIRNLSNTHCEAVARAMNRFVQKLRILVLKHFLKCYATMTAHGMK